MSASIGRRVGTLSKVIADLTGPLGDRVRWGLPESSIIAELLQEGAPWLDPASYVTTGSHDTFELRVRAHGRSPTSSFLLCFISMPPPGGCDCSSTQSSRGTTSTGIEVTWERVKAKFPDED